MKNIDREAGPLQFRQGDILLTKIVTYPEGTELAHIPPKRGAIILAEGEVTGHVHQVSAADAALLESERGLRFLEVLRPTQLRHPEHDAIELQPGSYALSRQREFHPFGERAISD